jgi:type VI protein secretion system component Hcp
MPEMTLTREDMQHLGSTLDQMAQTFDERERMLLLAIVELANEALVARAQQDEVTGFEVIHNPFSITMRQDCASPKLYSDSLGQLGGDAPNESVSLSFGALNIKY